MTGILNQYSAESVLVALGLTVFAGLATGIGSGIAFWARRNKVRLLAWALAFSAGVMDKFHYLKIGLGVVLSFVGVKMLLAHTDDWKIPTPLSLGVVVLILAVSVVWSLLRPKKVKLAVAADVNPVHLKPTKSEPTHVGCYKESGARGVTRPAGKVA